MVVKGMDAWGPVLMMGVLLMADSVMLIYVGTGVLALGIAILTPWYGARLRLSYPQDQGAIGGRLLIGNGQ